MLSQHTHTQQQPSTLIEMNVDICSDGDTPGFLFIHIYIATHNCFRSPRDDASHSMISRGYLNPKYAPRTRASIAGHMPCDIMLRKMCSCIIDIWCARASTARPLHVQQLGDNAAV